MAFVIGKQQKKSIFQPTFQTFLQPGPGSYSAIMNSTNKNSWQCAPFNNSQVKTSYFDVPQVKSGPGSYQPKYYKDLNHKSDKNNKGYVFASKVDRFNQQIQKNNKKNQPQAKLKLIYYQQPINEQNDIQNVQVNNYQTQYSVNQSQKQANKKQIYSQKLERSKSMMQEIRQNNNQHKVESIRGKKDFIRVILSSTTNTQNIQSKYIFKNMNGKGLGPGTYQNIDFKLKNKSITKWQLNKQKRFKTEGSQAPGPGYYQNNGVLQNNSLVVSRRKDKRLSSAFASTVIRSYMDSLIYKTNIPFKAAIMNDQKMKDLCPGPGSYNPQQMYKDKVSFNYGMYNNFGTCKKNQVNQQQYEQIGPGSYDVDVNSMLLLTKGKKCNKIIKDMRNQIFNKKGKISGNYNKNNSLEKSFSKKRISENQNTFSAYQSENQTQERKKKLTKFSSLQQRCFSKFGTMNQQQRFNYKQRNKSQIKLGPGQYYNPNIASDFSMNYIAKKGISSVFKSSTNRNTFQNKQTQQIPFYNVIKNDIGYKAERMKRYIENLKKININQIPFQVGEKRFQNGEQQFNQEEQELQNINQQYMQFINKQKNKPSSCFKSTTKRNLYTSQKKPGPADYDAKVKSNGAHSSLQKKSFNKNYGHLKVERKNQSQEKVQIHNKNIWEVSRKNSQEKRNKNMLNMKLTNRIQQKTENVQQNKQTQNNE